MEQRERLTIPLPGLNRTEPDLTVKDGTADTAHNLRYEDAAWRNVHPFRMKAPITRPNGFTILYRHPATAPGRYIATDDRGALHDVRLEKGAVVSVQLLAERTAAPHLAHFGNVLVLNDGGTPRNFLLEGGRYIPYSIPEPPSVSNPSNRYQNMGTHRETNMDDPSYGPGDGFPGVNDYGWGMQYWTNLYDRQNGGLVFADHAYQHWFGEVALFAALRLTDGSVVSPSSLLVLIPEPETQPAANYGDRIAITGAQATLRMGLVSYSKDTDEARGANRRFFIPTVRISGIETDNALVESLAVYCTAMHPVFDYDKITNFVPWETDLGEPWPFHLSTFYKDNDLPNRPFYELLTVPVGDIPGGQYEFEIEYNMLESITDRPVYVPTQNTQVIAAACYLDYNERLHYGGLQTRLFPGFSDFCLCDDFPFETLPSLLSLYTSLEINEGTKTVLREVEGTAGIRYDRIGRMVSYPDARARLLRIHLDTLVIGELPKTWQYSRSLRAAPANNYAYATNPSSYNVKYPVVPLDFAPGEQEPLPVPDDLTEEPNRLQVSERNNPFVLPFDLSYRIGEEDDRILSLATAADQLSETRYGAFPLYVFTDKGIWTLENGTGETLYANIVPVNHDRITNPSTATGRNIVYYVTSRGVHALKGRYAERISGALPLDAETTGCLDGATLFYLHRRAELLLFHPSRAYAYTYSAEYGYWATRDMEGRLLNNGLLLTSAGLRQPEQEQPDGPVECLYRTRPLKFGTTELKRIETVVARLQSEDCFVHLILEGSNDCRRWTILRDEWHNTQATDMRLRRTPSSHKYFRILLHLTANEPLALTGLDVEYYPRFRGKLR